MTLKKKKMKCGAQVDAMIRVLMKTNRFGITQTSSILLNIGMRTTALSDESLKSLKSFFFR